MLVNKSASALNVRINAVPVVLAPYEVRVVDTPLLLAAVPSPTASEILVNVGLSVLVAVVVTGVFGLIVLRLDSGDIRTALSRLRTRPSP